MKNIIAISWHKWDFAMLVSRLFSRGELLFKDVDDLVDKVLRSLGPGNRIWRLDVHGHGNSMSMNVGADEITAANLEEFEPSLSRLHGRFATGGMVRIHGCRSASHEKLLRGFARAFGTRVRMGYDLQWCFTPTRLDGPIAESFKGIDAIPLERDRG